MSTPVDLLTRPSSGRPPFRDEAVGLDALLEFFAGETPVSARRTLRRSVAELRGWVRSSSRRAAAWGAVAPAVVLVPRSSSVATEAGQ